MSDLFLPLSFPRGAAMANRFCLAPLTNRQSGDDGVLSEAEFHWLTMRARGGFGMVMTCAAHVQAQGQGFPGQLGVFADQHEPGLARLASALREAGALSSVQLHHAGDRSPTSLVAQPLSASDNPDAHARAMTLGEVEQLVDDFAAAALRADKAGIDGAELHGAHGYVIAQFLAPDSNRRTDRYGGSLENRARLLFEIVRRIREVCSKDFQLGVRISPDRFGLTIDEGRALTAELFASGAIDYVDMSLWDVTKTPDDPKYQDRTIMACFTDIPRHGARLGVSGKIRTADDARSARAAGADFVLPGRAGIIHHDLPQQVRRNAEFLPLPLPVSADHLRREGLSEVFIEYMRTWPDFVAAA